MKPFLSTLALTTLMVALTLPGISQPAYAQRQVSIGPRAGLELGGYGGLLLGADARVTDARLPVVLNAGFDYYFTDGGAPDGLGVAADIRYITIEVNGLYAFDVDHERIRPYAGAGLAYGRVSSSASAFGVSLGGSSSQLGLNLIGGAALETENRFRPFAQVRISTLPGSNFGLVGGLLFTLSD